MTNGSMKRRTGSLLFVGDPQENGNQKMVKKNNDANNDKNTK